MGEVVSGTTSKPRNGIYQHLLLVLSDAVSLNLAAWVHWCCGLRASSRNRSSLATRS